MNFKDEEFNKETLYLLGNDIIKAYPEFDIEQFVHDSLEGFPTLELKQRITHTSKMLEKYLTKDYLTNIDLLSKALKGVRGGRFVYLAPVEYVERNGCNEEFLDISLEKLGEYTSLLSSEFSIRAFLNTYEDRTLEKIYEWTQSKDVHKRRLATEGTRPRIPWAQNITVDYKIAAKVLDNLFYDKERYVTRSCANHLNDISKFDPDFVLDTLKRWKNSKKQSKEEMEYIIKHSLRTLVKKGHLDTLVFLGLKLQPKVVVSDIDLNPTPLHLDDDLYITFTVTPKENTLLLIDYIIHYPMKNGSLSKKVYKIKTVQGEIDKQFTITRKRPFHHMTTRKLYFGIHRVEIQINGTVYASKDFELTL